MDLRQYVQTETSSFIDRLLAAVDAERETQHAQRESLDAQLRETEVERNALRTQVSEANALVDALQHGIAVMRGRSQRVTALLRGSVKALDALGAAATVHDVFTSLVEQLAAEFPRVVIFRARGGRFEGELGAGMDESLDLSTLIIPCEADSVITRAATGGTLEHASAEDTSVPLSPFGDAPASALAAPLVFQDETLAVVYADSDAASNDAHTAFAGVLVAHANVLLSRLTQEMKTAKELREYAQMLLHEAEEMFLADLAEGRTEPDRLRRLHDTIEFGRQLYAQRAALEGPAVAGLLEDEIVALTSAEPRTIFADGLADALAGIPTAVG